MNTLVLWRIRSARITWLTSMLVLLLSRTPVLRVLVSAEFAAGSRLGEMLRALVPVALAAGAVNTVTGATQFTSNPASPAAATVNDPFNMVFAVTGAPSTTKCYSIDGPLPAGLTVPNATVSGTNRTLNASTGSITGTPTESGTFTVQIKAWEKASRGGKSTNAYNVTINVAGPPATPPAFTTQPTSQTVTAGASVTFTVAASGAPAPALQWRKGGTALAGRTGTSLTLSAVTTADAGSYDCVATNSAGSATSSPATLTVNAAATAPAFTTQPASQATTVGGSVTFTVAATGNPTPTLQWRFGGAALAGQTGSSLTIANVQAGNAGSYDCVATNSAGSATSTGATLTVGAPAAPSILTQPAAMTSLAGSGAYFGVVVNGTGLTYQWYKNGVAIPGATRSAYSIATVQASDAANYAVVVSNTTGQSTTSDSVALAVASAGSARLVNMSTRAGVGAVTGTLIPGLVIEGDVSLTLVIRAVGPGLSRFGVANPLADPVLSIYRGAQVVASNDDWGQAPDVPALTAAFSQVSAFGLGAGSKDCLLYTS
ncbi:MAG: immunoglobulin domain-containing protein, partial [Opitutaceae bacterium]|nr:immunoglobulin domain-containing protein [Opitutaceae bacterium]